MPWRLAQVAVLTTLVRTAEAFSTAVPQPAINADKATSWLPAAVSAPNHAARKGTELPVVRMKASNDDGAGRDDLRGKVAVVTGSSRGIGKGIAVTLGERGCTVYVTGRSAGGTSTDQAGLYAECV